MTVPDLTDSKFWIVVPQAGTNQIYNPRIDPPEFDTYLTAVSAALAESSAEQRKGAYSVAVTPQTGVASGFYYSAVSVVNGTDYTFSCDIKGVVGQAMRIYIADSAGTAKATTTFTATGYWQRVSVTHTAAETQTTYRVYVIRDAVASTSVFYVDGLQFETGDEMTTFIHGDAGSGYSWAGLPRQSASSRSDRTRAGGQLLCINDYAMILQVFGFGMGQFEQIMYPMSNGGDYYQQHLRRSRNIGFLLAYWGDNQGDMQRNRNTILEAVRPDYLDNQPVKIIYQGYDDNGNEATNPLEITCVLQPSHVDTPSLPVFQKDTLMFTVPSGHFDGAYEEGAELGLYETLTPVNYIISKDDIGNWENLDEGANGFIFSLALAPNGDLYAGGLFTTIGGITANYIAKWNGLAWSALGAGVNGEVYSLVFAPNGDLYVGGVFTTAGGVTVNHIAKWDGSTWSALGAGMSNFVLALAISPNGDLYVGGNFTTAGGSSANYVAKWDGSAWSALDTGVGNTVYCLAFAPNGDLYVGGNFTTAGGNSANYIAKWDGSTWSALGAGMNHEVRCLSFTPNGYLYAGGDFTTAGGITANYIAKWNGSAWSALGTGLNDDVRCLLFMPNGDLYVGGVFTTAGGILLSDSVAIYKNGAWMIVDLDMSGTADTYAIINSKSDYLYIAGETLGTATISATHTITNSGNTLVYPKFVITGPGVMGSISNFRTKKSIQFEGLTLQAGETITINLDPTNLYMRSSWEGRGNVLRYVAAGSDYGNFSLEPGENYINIYMPSGTTSASGGYMTYTPRFWNIEGAIYE